MWTDLIQSVESLKEQTLRLPGEEGIVPQDCNLGILFEFPACWPAPQNSNSRLQLRFFPGLPACQPALWILDLPDPTNPWANSLKKKKKNSLFLHMLFPNSSGSLETSDWYRPRTRVFSKLKKKVHLSVFFSVTLVPSTFCPDGLGDSRKICWTRIWSTPSLP